MKRNYIKDKPNEVTNRENWVFELFDSIVEKSDKGELYKKLLQEKMNELKYKMTQSYINLPNHKYHKYLQELIREGYISKDLPNYVLINNFEREYFDKSFVNNNGENGGITLGIAFPWCRTEDMNKSGSPAVYQIILWDVEAWLEKTSKWYWRLFHWKRDYEPLYPEYALRGTLLHELIHAKQHIVDNLRQPPSKNGSIKYKNYLEVGAFAAQFMYLDAKLGRPEHLERWNAKTYEEAANNYLQYLEDNGVS